MAHEPQTMRILSGLVELTLDRSRDKADAYVVFRDRRQRIQDSQDSQDKGYLFLSVVFSLWMAYSFFYHLPLQRSLGVKIIVGCSSMTTLIWLITFVLKMYIDYRVIEFTRQYKSKLNVSTKRAY